MAKTKKIETEEELIVEMQKLAIKLSKMSKDFILSHKEYSTIGETVDEICNVNVECSYQDGELAVVSVGFGNVDTKRVDYHAYPSTYKNYNFFDKDIWVNGKLIKA